MGLSSSTSTSTKTNAPTAYASPYINAGGAALQSTYGQTAPVAQNISTTLQGTLPTLASNITAGANTVGAANNYDQYVLGGGLLSGNPYLQKQIDATDNSVANRVNTTFSQAGRTGSGANTYALGSALANNETNLRYSDYTGELANMNAAAANASNLGAAGLNDYLGAGNGAVTIPTSAASGYAGSLGSLFGQYSTQTGTTTSTPSLGDILAKAAQTASLFIPK